MGVSIQLPCNPNLGLDWIELGWKLSWVVTIKSKKRSPRAYHEKDKPTGSPYGSGKGSNFQVRSMIFKSSMRSRNIPGIHRGVTGRITGKEIVTLDGARENELGGLPVRNTGQLQRKYRRMDTLKWTSRHTKEN